MQQNEMKLEFDSRSCNESFARHQSCGPTRVIVEALDILGCGQEKPIQQIDGRSQPAACRSLDQSSFSPFWHRRAIEDSVGVCIKNFR